MRSITEISLFKIQDSATGLKDRMLAYSSVTDDLDLKLIEDNMNTIHKRFTFPLKNRVVDELWSKKRVVPIFNKSKLKIPSYVPAYLYSDHGKPVALVNLTNYGVMDRNGNFEIDNRILFACLQTGVVLLGCYERWNSVTMNQTVSRLGSLAYARLFSKVLDKMFAVNLDPVKSDKIRFAAAKFFLTYQLQKTNSETVSTMAYGACEGGTTKATVFAFDASLPENAYASASALVDAISRRVEGLHPLTFRTFTDTWIRMYGTSTTFAIEYFPYFCHMLFSVAVGAHINSEYLIESVVGKDIDKIYNEMANILR